MINNLFENINILFFGLFLILIYIYRKYCTYVTFKNIDRNYKRTNIWEEELQIYSVSMPRFYTHAKKNKCILLISGFRDIPYLWKDLEEYFIKDKIDFYAPRTFSTGRSFFQASNYRDWIITYLEAIYILQEQYYNIDIIGFSAGSAIALYLSQFKFKCKINNLILCAPFLIPKKDFLIELFFSDNIYSKILNKLYRWTFRFHPKNKKKNQAGYRSTYNEYNSINDYCEIFGDSESENSLFELIKYKLKNIFVDNIAILVPNDDHVIGDINIQHSIINEVFNKKVIDIISIPSHSNHNLSNKCSHTMFKENKDIVENIYDNIKKIINNKKKLIFIKSEKKYNKIY